jgi:hypothetical protein
LKTAEGLVGAATVRETPAVPSKPGRSAVTAAYDIRMAMLANGYAPLPCETKRPVLTGWPNVKVTAELINGWDIQFPKAQNHGLRLEAFDLDISDGDVCESLENEIRDWFDGKGEILTRFGNPPRRLIPIRVNGDLTKVSALFKDPSGKEQGLELLGTRSQFLATASTPMAILILGPMIAAHGR